LHAGGDVRLGHVGIPVGSIFYIVKNNLAK